MLFCLFVFDGLVAALVYSLIPFIVRAAEGHSIFGGTSWGDVPAIIISLCMFLVTWFIFSSNFAFLVVAIIDFRRRLFVTESLDVILTKKVVRTRAYLQQSLQLKGKSLAWVFSW